MMDITKPATWTDEVLDSAFDSRAFAGLKVTHPLWASAIESEIARRAEIRIVRGEHGTDHDAAWYDSRPVVEDPSKTPGYDGADGTPDFTRHDAHVDEADPDCDDCQEATAAVWERSNSL